MARPKRFEFLTPRFVVSRYSISRRSPKFQIHQKYLINQRYYRISKFLEISPSSVMVIARCLLAVF